MKVFCCVTERKRARFPGTEVAWFCLETGTSWSRDGSPRAGARCDDSISTGAKKSSGEEHKQGWHHRDLPPRGGWSGAQMHLWKQRLLLWWVPTRKDKRNVRCLGSNWTHPTAGPVIVSRCRPRPCYTPPVATAGVLRLHSSLLGDQHIRDGAQWDAESTLDAPRPGDSSLSAISPWHCHPVSAITALQARQTQPKHRGAAPSLHPLHGCTATLHGAHSIPTTFH